MAEDKLWIYRGGAWKRRGWTDLPPYQPPAPAPPPPPPTDTGGGPVVPPPGPDSVRLPFNIEAIRTQMRNSTRKCFAHYFYTFPVSVDNATDYYGTHWNPGGALIPTADAPFAGQTRDKPLLAATRPLKRTEPNWMDLDKVDEIKQAIESGLDGFTPDILQVIQTGAGSERWTQNLELMRAVNLVNNPNFKIVPMPDSLASATRDPVILADHMAIMAKDPSSFKLPTGEFVLAPYAPERAPAGAKTWGPTGWATVLDRLRTFHKIPTLFNPCFLDSWTATTQAPAFASMSWMMSRWGDRDPVTSASTGVNNVGAAAKAHAPTTTNLIGGTTGYNVKWMHPVSIGDTRPRESRFWESWGFEQLVASWNAAIAGGADWVQIPTWSDYAEHAHIMPSKNHRWAFLDISSYFMARWKLGYFPTIIRDALYVAHRRHTAGYKGTQTAVQVVTGGTPVKDDVNVACFLTSAATVNVSVGGVVTALAAPAGFSMHHVPLRVGTVSAEAVRAGVAVAAVVSPTKVADTGVQDMNYYGLGSLR